MKHELPVENRVIELISTLQGAGFEAYIVGGAIRDLLLGRRPKDYDISTAATPEEVRNVFAGRPGSSANGSGWCMSATAANSLK